MTPTQQALSFDDWQVVLDALEAYTDKEKAEEVQKSILAGLYPPSDIEEENE